MERERLIFLLLVHYLSDQKILRIDQVKSRHLEMYRECSRDTGAQIHRSPSVVFQAHWQGAGLQLEQPELKPIHMYDNGVTATAKHAVL